MSNFWPRKWSQLRSKCEHWYSKRGIFKHHLTEIQHCYSPDGRPMKVIVLKNGEVYVTCMQFLSWRDSKNLLIYYDIFMTSAQELLFDRRSKEFWSLPYVHQILLLNGTSRFKRLTTSTIGVKKSLCRRLGCTWYLHQLTPEIWYAIFPLGCWTCVRNWLRRFDEDDFGW